jgi:hypothetical protein
MPRGRSDNRIRALILRAIEILTIEGRPVNTGSLRDAGARGSRVMRLALELCREGRISPEVWNPTDARRIAYELEPPRDQAEREARARERSKQWKREHMAREWRIFGSAKKSCQLSVASCQKGEFPPSSLATGNWQLATIRSN